MNVPVPQNRTPAENALSAVDSYRILLVRENGTEILLHGESSVFTLPCIDIPRWRRIAEHLTAALRAGYGVSAVSLFAPTIPGTAAGDDRPLYQVLEARDGEEAPPACCHWRTVYQLTGQDFADPSDFTALKAAVKQLSEFEGGQVRAPFARVGWIEQLFSWAEKELSLYGLHLTGKFRQLNADPTFSLLRLETNGPAVWFKAAGHPNEREFTASVALSRLFPGYVPTVLATRPEWNGWLTLECPAASLDEEPNNHSWQCAATTLAELQIASIGKVDLLLEAGCRDVRISALDAKLALFLEVMSQLMKQQPRTPPAVLDDGELAQLGRQLRNALDELETLKVPDTLGHLDLNPGNILCHEERCLFLDWAEAYVGPPFFTIEYLREHMSRLKCTSEDIGTAARSYQTRWAAILCPESFSSASALGPLLAAYAYAAGSEVWRNTERLRDAHTAASFRSLTRRMFREMQRLPDRSHMCCR